jgi:hypothetical protein
VTIENDVKWKMLLEVMAVGQETVRGICPVEEYQVRVEGLKVKCDERRKLLLVNKSGQVGRMVH